MYHNQYPLHLSLIFLSLVWIHSIVVSGILAKTLGTRERQLTDQLTSTTEMTEAETARLHLIPELMKALDLRLQDDDVQQFLSKKDIQQARQRWINEFESDETLYYVAHQKSSNYLAFLLHHLPLMDIFSDNLHFVNLLNNAMWAFHIRNLYPWAMKLDEQVYLEYVVPYAVVDEPRRGNWREKFQWEIERQILASMSDLEDSTPDVIQKIAAEMNRKIWTIFGNEEIVYSPNLTPEVMAPQDVIEKKKASCTGLSLLLIYAYRSIGIPARMTGVYSWNDDNGKTNPSVIARRQLLQSKQIAPEEISTNNLNNHSWVEIFDGTQWMFTGAHEQSAEGHKFNDTWFYPVKTNLQIPGDPIFGIYTTCFSNHSHIFPLAWNPSYEGVYGSDVTKCYQMGYQNCVNPTC